MYCKECNITFDDHIKFCNRCGAELIKESEKKNNSFIDDGHFDKLYWQVESKVRRYLYHRVPVDQLQSCIEEMYDGLLSALEVNDIPEEHFSQWFNRFLYRYSLRYTGLHNIFSEGDIEFYEPKYEQEDSDLRIERDITMGEEKRINLLNYILSGVSEQERICISQYYIEKMSVDMIASSMHIRPVVVEYYLAKGNDRLKDNLKNYQEEFGSTLFGMTEMAFIIWIMQYDDMSHIINAKEVLYHVKNGSDPQNDTITASNQEENEELEQTIEIMESAEPDVEEEEEADYPDDNDEYDDYDEEYREKSAINMRNLTYKEPKDAKPSVYDDLDYEEDVVYDDYDDEEGNSKAIKIGNLILKILIGLCIIVLVGLCALIATNLLSDDEKEAKPQVETTRDENQPTAAVKEEEATVKEGEAADKKESTDLQAAEKQYERFLKNKKLQNHFYAVLEAGDQKAPILIVAAKTEDSEGNNFHPAVKDKGYTIEGIYQIYNGKVTEVTRNVKQPEKLGAWRFYKDRLSSYTKDGGIRSLKITGDKYSFIKQKEIPKDYDLEAAIIHLKEFTGSEKAATEAKVESTQDAILEDVESVEDGVMEDELAQEDVTEKKTEEKTEQKAEEKTEEKSEDTSEEEKSEETSQKVQQIVEVKSDDGFLNVRAEADMESEVIDMLSTGDWVDIVEIKDGWGKLSDGGWINLAYTEQIQ